MARKPAQNQIAELFSTSEENVEHTRKAFEVARTTLNNARTYGTPIHATAAKQAFVEAAEIYGAAMRTHANIVRDYAAAF